MLRCSSAPASARSACRRLTATDYVNTIPPEDEPWFPGDEEVERRYRAWLRWNAAIMVHRAQRPGIGVGGHISSYASSATLYEVGFNHFFRGKDHEGGGDQIYIQGHASPGIYARAYLEGRLTEDQLDGFRQELSHPGGGLPSYPHPRLMPDFWEFPTVSMGLGPMNAIYQAQFNKYLHGPRHQGHLAAARLGVPRRRRDGRAGEPRAAARRRVRGARQPDLRRQLQPAAARRPGARQRQDHPGARVALPRRRLERHQGRLGSRVGPAAGRGPRRRAGPPDELDARTATTRPSGPRTARTSRSTSSGATRAPARWSRTSATTRSGRSSAAATTTARSTRRTRPRWSTPASRRSSWPRRSRATASARTSPGATPRTR